VNAADRWCWLGFVDASPDDALATADAYDLGGDPAGTLVAWPSQGRRRSGAVRVARHVIDPDGPRMAVSWAVAPRGVHVLFDDPAVVHAIRATYGRQAAFLSTLVQDAAHIAGAITGLEAELADRWSGWWDDDPFARIFGARRLLVGPGLFRRVPAPEPG
jgi:hypothetical protein